jgi:hypothetical protein
MRGVLEITGKGFRYRLVCPGMDVDVHLPDDDDIDFGKLEGATVHVRGYLRNITHPESLGQQGSSSFAHTRCFIDVQEYEIIEEKKQPPK